MALAFVIVTYCVYLVMSVVQPNVYNYNVANHPSHYHYISIPNLCDLAINDEHILSVLGTCDGVQ